MDIPKKSKLVFKGSVFSVYTWKQKMFDGKYQTFEGVRRAYSTQVIATLGGKIIMTREKQPGSKGWWAGVPGGRIEEGEIPLQSAKRELLEESGLVSDDWEFVAKINRCAGMDWKIYWFVARNCRKVSPQRLESGEIIKIRGVAFEEFIRAMQETNGSFLKDLKYDRLRMSELRRRILGK